MIDAIGWPINVGFSLLTLKRERRDLDLSSSLDAVGRRLDAAYNFEFDALSRIGGGNEEAIALC